MSTLFLTGGSGFVGSHAGQAFLDRGWRVKALLRRPDRPGRMPAGVQVVQGELNEPEKYRGELAGVDAVLHVAGVVRARNLAEFRRANVQGTEQLALAAAEVCPRAMFVYVSSQAAAGPAREGRPITEQDVPNPISWYGQSKLEAEEALRRCHRGPWVVVRPSVIYGPGDAGLLQLFSVVARGFAPNLAGGARRVQLLAVEDLTRVLWALAQRPDLHGRRGFAAGDVVSMGEIARELARMRTPPAWIVPIPGLLIRLAGLVESLRETITGRTLPFNRDKAREILAPDWLCDSQPLLSDLGIGGLRSWREGLRQTCRWYLDAHWLPPRFAGV